MLSVMAANAWSVLRSPYWEKGVSHGDVAALAGLETTVLVTTGVPVLGLAIVGWLGPGRGMRLAALAGLVVVDLTALPLMVMSNALLARPSQYVDDAMGPIIIGIFGGLVEYAVAAVVLAGCGLAWLVRPRGAEVTSSRGSAAPGPPRRRG